MRHFLRTTLLPGLVAAIVLTATTTSHAQLFGLYWGSYYPSYSTYYTPSYSSYYTPSYSTYYAPSTYTASYVPSYTTSYVPSVSYYEGSSCCGVQTSYSAAACPTCPTTCCSPCTSCVACPTTCCDPCAACGTCCGGDCELAATQGQAPAPAQPPAASGTTRNPTFIEEQDRGTGTQQYDNNSPGTGDGFTPRNSDDSDMAPDPLDQTFGTASAGRRDELRFKIPQPVLNRRKPAPSHPLDFHKNPTQRVKSEEESNYPLLKLDEKITSRSMPKRTRLVERRSWEEPVIAKNIRRETPESNLGWVPVPAPTQLVQK